MDVSNGKAAFDRFPYAFENLSAKVYFDNDKLEVRDVRGTAPSGATLAARADVAPVHKDAEIKVWVEVTGAPIDEAMERAFGPGRNRVVQALFNREKHQRLLNSGLVISPAHAEQLRADLDRAREERERAGGDGAEEAGARVAELERAIQRSSSSAGRPTSRCTSIARRATRWNGVRMSRSGCAASACCPTCSRCRCTPAT
jgi:hypothetical protein